MDTKRTPNNTSFPNSDSKAKQIEKPNPPIKSVMETKVVLLGDTGVGKTSIASRFVENNFNMRITTSVGASFLTKTIELDGTRIKLRLWDTAGQERFRSLAPMYYRGASTAILCYDLTSKNSFAKVKTWVQELQNNIDYEMILVVVGNKLDREKYREVSTQEGRDYAQSISSAFFEVSAKTGQGIDEVFLHIGKRLLAYKKQNIEEENFSKVELPHPVNNNSFLSTDQNFETADSTLQEPSPISQPPPRRSGCCS